MSRIQLFAIAGGLFLVVFIVEMVRRRRLKVEYSILWIIATLIILVLALFRKLLDHFSELIGIYYSPAALLLVTIFFGVLLFIHFSIVMTKLSIQNTAMAQRLALLEESLRELKEKGKAAGGTPPAAAEFDKQR